jgi:hypothetical protein
MCILGALHQCSHGFARRCSLVSACVPIDTSRICLSAHKTIEAGNENRLFTMDYIARLYFKLLFCVHSSKFGKCLFNGVVVSCCFLGFFPFRVGGSCSVGWSKSILFFLFRASSSFWVCCYADVCFCCPAGTWGSSRLLLLLLLLFRNILKR